MTETTDQERTRLQRLLAARDGKSGFTKNVAAIRARLAALDAQGAAPAQHEAKNV